MNIGMCMLKISETSHEYEVTVLLNQQVQTAGTIHHRKPGITIRDNEGACMLIDVAISGDTNVVMKEAEILKYKD
jgi:hypothetical protein